MQDTKPIQVGILGYGLSGRIFHGAIIASVDGYVIKRIIARDPEKQALARTEHPSAIVSADVEDVFSDLEIDLVVVSTHNTTHADFARRALLSDKHVVVEKPFTVTSEEAKQLIMVAEQTGKVLSVYQNRRYDSDFLTVKKIIESGELGRIVAFESHFDRFRPEPNTNAWREEALPGSGTFYDLGPHLIDQALTLFGYPEALYADITNQRKGKVDDAFGLILYYPELQVHLKASNLVKEPTPRFAIYGTAGSFVKYGLDVQESKLREDGIRPPRLERIEIGSWLDVASDWGVESENMFGKINSLNYVGIHPSEKGDYRRFYTDLYDSISQKKPPYVTGSNGQKVIEIIEAAFKSNLEKKRISL
jgi:predicted dehydrogenase